MTGNVPWLREQGSFGELFFSAKRQAIEHVAIEKGKMRGGGTAPPGPNRAERPRFFRETTGRMVWNAKRSKPEMLEEKSHRYTLPRFGEVRGDLPSPPQER